jgi:hypothetical protein
MFRVSLRLWCAAVTSSFRATSRAATIRVSVREMFAYFSRGSRSNAVIIVVTRVFHASVRGVAPC